MREGKFHQIKRMFGALGHEVTALSRLTFGALRLPAELPPGQYRELTEEELSALREEAGLTKPRKGTKMPDHYYTQTPTSAHKPGQVDFLWRGRGFVFETDSGVFSRTEIDKGTEILLNALPEELTGSLLDLGCGYGVIGVTLGRRYPGLSVTMSDVRRAGGGAQPPQCPAQTAYRRRVMQSDGYASIPFRRYRLDFARILPYPGGKKRDLRHVRRGSPPAGAKRRAVAGDPQAAGCGVRRPPT